MRSATARMPRTSGRICSCASRILCCASNDDCRPVARWSHCKSHRRTREKMLSQQQLDFYAENGYVLAPGIFSAEEIAEMRREIDATVERVRRSGRRIEALWGGAWREKLLPEEE